MISRVTTADAVSLTGMKNIPYRFHEFHTPTGSPFDQPASLWTTIVGELIRPVVKQAKEIDGEFVYWFCYHGADFQFCFASQNFQQIEAVLDTQRHNLRIRPKTSPTDGKTVASALIGTRWLPADKIGDSSFEAARSELVLRTLHSACKLFIHSLRQDIGGNQWRLEPNSSEQNPLGNLFESMLHMVSNLSQAQFDVHLGYATAWMPLRTVQTLRCHL